ncbi:MAG: chemoreceptor glutamine deamidase CheD [Rhodanobacter sp.]|nr:MAG: chemoreceptor glutamine deamidase CheD [Rhodanobacter sp.]TAM03389.1 MAG: chemoreceptor glutamine deamidase CheD [Rhodanobacter sp.]TAM41587.1 MAG: chemoreceptor glutamine deamidase CheD [Rhodanobacter sp.]TAN28378.1 MAG: chemoreceptor glutamine deamidase CheD [Rhodanobacter sp.]
MAERRVTPLVSPAPPGFEHLRRFWDPTHGCMTVKLLPGEFYVSDREEMVSTVLGSCVSACIHDSRRRLGGMNHFMLPEPFGARDSWSSTVGRAARYGTDAMEQLINALLKAGGQRADLRVKVFGGARVLARMSDVGQRNIEFVQRYLATENLAVVASDLGDAYPRQVQFFPHSGRARVRLLRRRDDLKLVADERGYLKRLANDPIKGEVELF